MATTEAMNNPGQDEYENYLWHRRYNTMYRIRLSVLYNLKRERFFDSVDKASSMITAVAATAAVGTVLKKAQDVEVWATAITAALSLIPLVYNPAERARRHGQAAAEFRRLLADGERAGEEWSQQQCDTFAARVLELEATEPAPRSALVIDCQNQLALASGTPDKCTPLRWYERWFKQWWDFDAVKISRRTHKAA